MASVLILTMAVSSLSIMVTEPVYAQVISPQLGETIGNIPTPSVPVFTIQNVNSTSFTITIKNQPFTPFNITTGEINQTPTPTPTPPASGSEGAIPHYNIPVYLYYDIRVSNNTNSEWAELYYASNGYPMQSNLTTTVIRANWVNGVAFFPSTSSVFVGSEFSVEVEAIIGWIGRYVPEIMTYPYVIFGEASGWSNPQTITIPLISSSPTPTTTPTVPELSWLVFVPLPLSVFFVAVILRHQKQVKKG